jgi:hypothetical protein
LRVPDWVDEERVKKSINKFADELIESSVQTAEEARRFYGVKETRSNIEVPLNLDEGIMDTRRKRYW